MRYEEVIPSITTIYEFGGIRGVKVSTLGSKKVLMISFPSLEEVSSQVKVLNVDHNQVVVSLERWVPKPIVLSRIVWLHCFGVPLHGWSVEVFLAIGRKFREVEEIDKETMDKSQLKFGRVSVQTKDFSFINKEMETRIFDDVYKVVVREELGSQTFPVLNSMVQSRVDGKMHSLELVDSTSTGCSGDGDYAEND